MKVSNKKIGSPDGSTGGFWLPMGTFMEVSKQLSPCSSQNRGWRISFLKELLMRSKKSLIPVCREMGLVKDFMLCSENKALRHCRIWCHILPPGNVS